MTQSWSYQRNATYWLDADEGLWPVSDEPLTATASFGPVSEAPIARFSGDFRSSNYSHDLYGFTRQGYIAYDEEWDPALVIFDWDNVPSCLVPPWLNP